MDCSSEAVQLLSDEVTAPMELKKGMSIFLDVSTVYDLRHAVFIQKTCVLLTVFPLMLWLWDRECELHRQGKTEKQDEWQFYQVSNNFSIG